MHRERERKNRLAIGKVKKASEVQDGLKELDPEQLGKLQEFLARADLSNLMRRQPVCAITPAIQIRSRYFKNFTYQSMN